MHIRMDWKTVNFDWNRARGFLVTAREGSLSAAARALGTTQSTIGRQVSALEAELGVALFERIGRGLVLTPSGLELAEHVEAMGEGARRMSLAAAGQSQTLEGLVRIAASEPIATFQLPRIVAMLREREPGLHFEVIASNIASDLGRREADIAIRHFRPVGAELIGRKIKDSRFGFYATPGYLSGIGNPETVAEFSKARFIGFDNAERFIEPMAKIGLTLTEDSYPVMSANPLVQWAFVKEGMGIGMMSEIIGDAEPLVVRVLRDVAPFVVPLWLVAHRELKTSRKIRLVFDVLAAELV